MAKASTASDSGKPAEGTGSNAPETSSRASEKKTKKFLQYQGNQFETRVLSAADFQKLREGSELKKTEWSPENDHKVDVSGWDEADIEAVLTQPNFKLVEQD